MSRTVIISDLHMGRPTRSPVTPEQLKPLWEGADRLIVNGDLAEVHHPEYRARAARLTMELLELCESDGVILTILSGNHDPYLSDIRHLRLAGGSILVTHGDVMHPAIAPWSLDAPRLQAAFERALESLPREDRDDLTTRLLAAQHASHAEWEAVARQARHTSIRALLMRPWSIARVLHYWKVFPQLAADFLARYAPDATYVVLGHTHRPGSWQVDGRVIMNTGGFVFPRRPHAVVLDDRSIALHRIRRFASAYECRPTPVSRYRLPPDSDAGPPSAENTRPGGLRSTAAAM